MGSSHNKVKDAKQYMLSHIILAGVFYVEHIPQMDQILRIYMVRMLHYSSVGAFNYQRINR